MHRSPSASFSSSRSIMNSTLLHGTKLHAEVKEARVARQLKRISNENSKAKKKRLRADALKVRDPWG